MGIIIFIVILVVEIFASFEFGNIAEEKGYSKNKYLLWCLFFPMAGYLMVVALPNRVNARQVVTVSEQIIDTDELPDL